jgi:hypothetical protein
MWNYQVKDTSILRSFIIRMSSSQFTNSCVSYLYLKHVVLPSHTPIVKFVMNIEATYWCIFIRLKQKYIILQMNH